MPLQLDNRVFEEELLRLRNQLRRYLFDDRAWSTTNRSNWFLSWYRTNQSWLQVRSLERVSRLPQAKPPSEASPFDRYGKSVLSNLLTNYENAPWYKRFVWWFRLPLTKMYSLNAAYQVLDRLPAEKGGVAEVANLKEIIASHLLKIRPVSSVFAFFKQAQDRIETKIKYSPSNQLKASLGEYLEELAKYGKQSKSFFSWQSHADFARELGFDNDRFRTVKWSQLGGKSLGSSRERKEREVLYFALLQANLRRCAEVLLHPLPDKVAQESRWQEVIGRTVTALKKGEKDLMASSTIGELCRKITRELTALLKDNHIEVQLADYQKILSVSLNTDPPEVVASIQAQETPSVGEKVIQLNATSLALCLKLEVEGVYPQSKEVAWDKIRKRYKELCLRDHPDRCQDDASKEAATEKFKTLQKDYQSLLKALESGRSGNADDDIDEEIREEYERANRFFDDFEKRLDKFGQSLSDWKTQLSRVYDESDKVIRQYQESQGKQIELQNSQIGLLKVIEGQQKKQEELLKEQLAILETRKEQQKEEERIAKAFEESERSYRQNLVQLEQTLLTIFHREQAKNPEIKLLRLTPPRQEAFFKLDIEIFNKDWDLLSWNQIRARHEVLCKQFSPENFREQSKQALLDRFETFQKDYLSLLAELDQVVAGEDVTDVHSEVAKEREKLEKLAIQFRSDLEKYDVLQSSESNGYSLTPSMR